MGVHKFTVPDEDMIVEKWIAKQSNFGFSIRMMIKFFVQNYGYGDVTCMALGLTPKKRGRPSKQIQQKMDQMFDMSGIDEDDTYGDDFDEYGDTQAGEAVAALDKPAPVGASTARSAAPPAEAAKPAPAVKDGSDDVMDMFNKPPSVGGNTDGDDDDDMMASLIG